MFRYTGPLFSRAKGTDEKGLRKYRLLRTRPT